jgi:hypothetical protein
MSREGFKLKNFDCFYPFVEIAFVVVDNKIKDKDNKVIYSINLVSELNEIFGLTRKQLKWYIKSWILSNNRNFDFKTYWAFKFSVYFRIEFSSLTNLSLKGFNLIFN